MKKQILILFLAFKVHAQKEFTLQQCIDYTLKNNPSLFVQQNNVAIAKAKSWQTLSEYLPQVSGSATMLNNIQLQTNVLPAGILGPDPSEITFGTKYNTNAAVDVKQIIYDQSKITGIKAAKPYAEISVLQQKQNQELLIYNTGTAYYQVLIYREKLHILKSNQQKYEQMVKVLQYQYEKGTVLEKDVDRVQVNLNTTSYQIQDSQTKEILALNILKNAMGMDAEENFNIVPTVNYELLAAGNFDENLVLDNLTETAIDEQSLELQKYSLKAKQASFIPTLTAVGRFGQQALNNDFSNSFNNWSAFSYVGLSLNVPIFSGFKRKSEVQEEKLKLKNEELNFKINKQNLELRFDNAKTAMGTAYSAYMSSKDNMVLAKKLLDVTDYQYQRGVTNLTDYLNDDLAYKESQGNYINSLYNLMISQMDYQKSKGSLLSFMSQIR